LLGTAISGCRGRLLDQVGDAETPLLRNERSIAATMTTSPRSVKTERSFRRDLVPPGTLAVRAIEIAAEVSADLTEQSGEPGRVGRRGQP
jgi:hypothetical protein